MAIYRRYAQLQQGMKTVNVMNSWRTLWLTRHRRSVEEDEQFFGIEVCELQYSDVGV
jgi:hypothetical protein